jgi:Beta-lactamase enzyme family
MAILLALVGFFVSSQLSTPAARPRHDASGGHSSGRKAVVTPAAQKVDSGTEDLFTVPAVATYLDGQTDNITAAVYNDLTGTTSLYHPGVADDTASIIKVDILATLLSEAQAQDLALTPEEQELSQEMIEESDDDDAQDLWDSEGGATAVGHFDAAAGLTQTTPDAAGYWGLTTTTAADQVQLLKKVAYPNPLLTDSSRSYELDLMTHVDPDQAWGVSSGVATGATVAIKNGWLPLDSGGWEMNSIGFINGDGRNYLVAVLTDGNANEAQGIDAIEGLSDLIWKQLAPPSRTEKHSTHA